MPGRRRRPADGALRPARCTGDLGRHHRGTIGRRLHRGGALRLRNLHDPRRYARPLATLRRCLLSRLSGRRTHRTILCTSCPAVPGGGPDAGETPEQTAIREVAAHRSCKSSGNSKLVGDQLAKIVETGRERGFAAEPVVDAEGVEAVAVAILLAWK